MRVERLNRPAYVVDPETLARYPESRNVFGRRATDSAASFFGRSQYTVALARARAEEPGYGQVDAAMAAASWTAAEHFHGAYGLAPLGEAGQMLKDMGRHTVTDRAEMSAQVKTAARLYGAGKTGICTLDRRWVYAENRRGQPIIIPDELTHAVVMAIPMDVPAISETPTYAAAAATGAGYSRMALAASSLAQFIRRLGYRAQAMGNDTALSIPLAVDAGLGEMGRNGLLITPEHGSCVRLCKVFTDLPLLPDGPITMGIEAVCRTCRRCAEACEVGAISKAPEPSFEVACISTRRGVRKWAVNSDLCYSFWLDNGTNCSTCIAVCPFTPKRRGDGEVDRS